MNEQIKRKIELLAPGGDVSSVKAAIYAGADAVYCGLSSFNARQRASNLTLQEVEELVSIAEQRNCQLYLTLNTLVFDHEIPELLKLLESVYRTGIRTVIVQDLGLLHILKTYLPEISVHASTQMTTHNAGQISFLSQFGVTQINLSRELSIAEIQPLCDVAHEKEIKVEVFVHGAFCVSFSGQCYMSSALCGKSGNRGECVQPCRRQYSVEGGRHNKSDLRPIFNLKDNYVFSEADSLYNAGVDSFKIEGRIKKFFYVYNVTSAWREQVDALQAGETIRRIDDRMDTVFNRDFTSGYVKGKIDENMFTNTSRDQSLDFVANVTGYWADKQLLTIDRNVELPVNSEVLIYTTDFTFICKGVLSKKISPIEYQFTIEHKLKGKISKGHQVFTQEIPEQADAIRSAIDSMVRVKVPLTISVSGSIGSNLKAVFTSPKESVTLFSQMTISAASRRPLDRESLYAQFSRLGTSPFVLEDIDISDLSENSFISQQELNRMRREAVEKLSGISIDPSRFIIPQKEYGSALEKKPKKAFFIDEIHNADLSEKKGDATVLIIPNSIKNVDTLAESINQNKNITPFFGSILIGQQFTDAIDLLNKLDGRMIISDNTGVAHVASRSGVHWIAGPSFNIVNSYAIDALISVKGFCGLFLSPEFSKQETGQIQIPPHIELWLALNYKRPLFTTRQCLIRNISGCSKKVCDDDCLYNCDRSEMVVKSKGKRFRVVKKSGFYTTVL